MGSSFYFTLERNGIARRIKAALSWGALRALVKVSLRFWSMPLCSGGGTGRTQSASGASLGG